MSADLKDTAAADGDATPADPGAIDLKIIRAHYELPSSVPNSTIDALIAAVEALREQIEELKVEKQGGWECLISRAEAAEAREAALAGALKGLFDLNCISYCDYETEKVEAGNRARAVLAATPAEVMEWARAMGAVLKAAEFFMEDGIAEDSPDLNKVAWQALHDTLAMLDALGKE